MATTPETRRSDGRLLLDLPEVANALSLSVRSVQNLCYRGQLRSLTVGRSRRVAVADLDAFVESLRCAT
jgi:excisionase family DNA binding protein